MKQDVGKENVVNLFSDLERQQDFQFKQDGSDGGQNIYAARYKGIYLNNTITNRINNTNIENGIIAGMPGAARYMFPERFRKGNRQMINRFFSATMHYNHMAWKSISGVAPQLIAIIPENINDSSASAVSATFEPKIAFYKGVVAKADYGGWRWIGDPNGGGFGVPTYAYPASEAFDLPFMFSVNYGHLGEQDPVLSYCPQRINTNDVPGLMQTYFLKRLAIMRHGKQYRPWTRLGVSDFTDWLHRNVLILGNGLYYLMEIGGFNPLSDNAAQCTMWKVAYPDADDLANCYPSTASMNGDASLGQFDLRYAPLLLYPTDIPQVL